MPRLTKFQPKGEEAGRYWQGILDRTRSWRNSHRNGDKAWRRFINLYAGKHWKDDYDVWNDPDSDTPRHRITVNQTQSIILNTLPFLVQKNPVFQLDPRRPEDTVSVLLQKGLLNYTWQEVKAQRQLRKSALDSLVIGHGVLKIGYEYELDESKFGQEEGNLEFRDYVKKAQPYIQRVSPFNFYFDPEAMESDLESARWCIEVFVRPKRDVIENERYDATTRRQIQNGMVEPTTVQSYLKLGEDVRNNFGLDRLQPDENIDMERVVLYEVWDKRTGYYFVFAHGVHRPLRQESEWPYAYLEGFPYEMLSHIIVPDDPLPLGVPASIEDQQHELNRNRTSMFQHNRRFNRKYTVNVDMLASDEELPKLVAGEDGTIIQVTDDSSRVVTPIEDAPIPSDRYRVEAAIKDDMREITGQDELIRGGSLPSRTSATEVGTRERLFSLKLDDRVAQLDEVVHNVGRKMLQHMKANYAPDKVMRIMGPQGAFWVSFTTEDIQAEYDMTISSTSMPKHNEENMRQQKMQLYNFIVQGMQVQAALGQQSEIDLNELLRWVLESFNDTQDMGRFFARLNQPLEPQVVAPGGGPGSPPNSPEAPTPANQLSPEALGAEARGPGQAIQNQLNGGQAL